MRTRALGAAVLTAACVLALGSEPGAEGGGSARQAGPPGLLEPGRLARAARSVGTGPRGYLGLRVNRTARVSLSGTPGTRTVLVIGCLDGARCAASDLVDAALVECPPTTLDLWTVRGIRGGAVRDGWRAVRRLVSDARPETVVLYRDRPLRPGGVAGWIRRVLPTTRVVELSLPTPPAGLRRADALARLRAAIGLDAAGGWE